jgi:uncharacterized protein (DUF1697 family)
MLRGVNVTGYKRVKMDELARLYTSLGYRNVRTYVQSGNVVFDANDDLSASTGKIEKKLKQQFGFDIPVLIRTKNDFHRLIENNPFANKDDSKLHVTFLYTKTADLPTDRINRAVGRGEAFSVAGREIYLYCPNGYGRTKLSNTFFEKTLKVIATTRNWRTVNALHSMVTTSAQN